MDAVGAAHAQRVRVLARPLGEHGGQLAGAGDDHLAGAAELEGERRVEHVGRGEAEVDPATRRARRGAENVDEGGHVMVRDRLALLHRLDREGGSADGLEVVVGGPLERLRRCHLHVAPGGHPGLVGPDGPQLRSCVASDHARHRMSRRRRTGCRAAGACTRRSSGPTPAARPPLVLRVHICFSYTALVDHQARLHRHLGRAERQLRERLELDLGEPRRRRGLRVDLGGGRPARRGGLVGLPGRLDLVGGRGGGSEDGEGDEGGAERGLDHDQGWALLLLPMTRGSNGVSGCGSVLLGLSSEHSFAVRLLEPLGQLGLGAVAADRDVLLDGLVELLCLASSGQSAGRSTGQSTVDWNASCSLVSVTTPFLSGLIGRQLGAVLGGLLVEHGGLRLLHRLGLRLGGRGDGSEDGEGDEGGAERGLDHGINCPATALAPLCPRVHSRVHP